MRNLPKYLLACICFSLFHIVLFAQSPGLIVRPAGGNGVTALNPNGDGYTSATTGGFTTDDIAQSEIAFKVVPAAITEPTGDLLTGPSGGFTDIVKRVDGSGFYLYKDASNIYFRLRIGGIISGSKGYSVLIDTDNKMGGSGPYANPNYVAPSGNSPGNPGFEYEVVLQTNFQVAVYSIDGSASPGTPVTYSLATNSQISVALSTDGNNPDYFYDWYVPLTAIGSPAAIKTAVTTVTSPNSSLQGTRSDIYGIPDGSFANTSGAWQTVVNAQPSINLSSFTGVSATCTAAPALNSPIVPGASVSVTGTWTRLDASTPSPATITLYKNGVSAGSTSVASGGTWTIVVPTVSNGDVFYAKAQASGESQCLQSNSVTASACTSPPAAPVLTCASLKGISGTMPSTASGNTVSVYLVPASAASPASNLVSTGGNLTYPTTTSFAYYTNGCSGGSNNVTTGVYMIVTQNSGCNSSASFVCVSSGSSGTPPPLSTNSLTISQPLYASATSISGSGSASGDILRLFINGQYISTITATATSFSFSGVSLNSGDQIQIYSQTGSACMTQSSVFTVSCFTQPPVITTNATGNLLSGATSISGNSAYPGASVQLYKGVYPSGTSTGSPSTVNSSGAWTVTTASLISGETYYAIQTIAGCASAASASASVLTATANPTITGSYTDASTLVNGTMPSAFTGTIRLYQDGAFIGSQAISATTNWSISPAAGTLYYNGVLVATAQASGSAESTGSNNVIVGCTSPATPAISPASTTIATGNTVTYTVNNVAAGTWYALLGSSTGISYATSSYRTGTSSFTLTSNVFSSAGTYNLNLSADALSGCPASIASAIVTVSSTLPLQLLDFNGNYANGLLSFNWSTSQEINLQHFELEESSDGNNFSSIASIAAQTNAAAVHYYTYGIAKQLQLPTYYRLKMVDNDGKLQFSKTILLKPAKPSVAITVGPNPFNAQLVINYTVQNNQQAKFSLLDVYGRLIKSKVVKLTSGNNQVLFNSLNSLGKGLYFLTINSEQPGDASYTYKVEKQ
ncbi:MAG: T9SS type A sorting domain-containing protein [Chitinophagaceae bacterium]